jgi:hypothetical protein
MESELARVGNLRFFAAKRLAGACVQSMHITSTSPHGLHMTEPTELTIVVTSFEDLYLREFPGLIAVATALSGYDGEDLVQDAMVSALVNWEKVRRLDDLAGGVIACW